VTIPAHDNRIAAMSFNSLGNRIATASEKVSFSDMIAKAIRICQHYEVVPVSNY